MVSCDPRLLSSSGCICFSQPAICWGDQSCLSLRATVCRNCALPANLHRFGRRARKRPLRRTMPRGSDHSPHCGESLSSPSRAHGPATLPKSVQIVPPRDLWRSPRAPTMSKPALNAAGVLVGSRHRATADHESTTRAYRKLARSPSAFHPEPNAPTPLPSLTH